MQKKRKEKVRDGNNPVRKVYNGFPFFAFFTDSIMKVKNKRRVPMNKSGITTKALLIGIGAVFLYGQFGPVGVIILGTILLLMN